MLDFLTIMAGVWFLSMTVFMLIFKYGNDEGELIMITIFSFFIALFFAILL